jgi:hypothetical protein
VAPACQRLLRLASRQASGFRQASRVLVTQGQLAGQRARQHAPTHLVGQEVDGWGAIGGGQLQAGDDVHEVHLIPRLVPACRESYRGVYGSFSRAVQPLCDSTAGHAGAGAAWYCSGGRGRQRGRRVCGTGAPAPGPC